MALQSPLGRALAFQQEEEEEEKPSLLDRLRRMMAEARGYREEKAEQPVEERIRHSARHSLPVAVGAGIAKTATGLAKSGLGLAEMGLEQAESFVFPKVEEQRRLAEESGLSEPDAVPENLLLSRVMGRGKEKIEEVERSMDPEGLRDLGLTEKLLREPGYTATESVTRLYGEMAGPLALRHLGKAKAAKALVGGRELEQAYSSLRERGAEAREALVGAVPAAIASFGLEYGPLESIFRPLNKTLVQRFAQQALTEGTTEALQVLPVEISAAITGLQDWKELLSPRVLLGMLEGGAVGAMAGGPFGLIRPRGEVPDLSWRDITPEERGKSYEPLIFEGGTEAVGVRPDVAPSKFEQLVSQFRSAREGRFLPLGDVSKPTYDLKLDSDNTYKWQVMEALDFGHQFERELAQLPENWHGQVRLDAVEWLTNPEFREGSTGTLQEEMIPILEDMRRTLDDASSEAVDLMLRNAEQGAAAVEGLPETIKGNLGAWMRQSWMLHVDPRRKEELRSGKLVQLRIAAEEEIARDLVQKQISGGLLPNEIEAVAQAETIVAEMIEGDAEAFFTAGSDTASLMAASSKIFEDRMSFGPSVTEMLGPVKDPVLRYLDGYTRLRRWIAKEQFAQDMLTMGDERVFWSDRNARASVPITIGFELQADGSALPRQRYTTPEIKLAMEEALHGHQDLFRQIPGELLGVSSLARKAARGYLKTNAATKLALTVGNLPSHPRNFLYWPLAAMQEGLNPASTLKAFQIMSSRNATIDDFYQRMGIQGWDDFFPMLLESSKRGVFGESAYGREAEEYAAVARGGRFGQDTSERARRRMVNKHLIHERTTETQVQELLDKYGAGTIDFIRQLYGDLDDFPRHMIWLEKVKQLADVHGVPPDQMVPGNQAYDYILDKAAQDIRNRTVTWSMAPGVATGLRRVPLVAPFPTFYTEWVRTYANSTQENMRLATDGRTHKERMMGARALIGSTLGYWTAEAVIKEMGQRFGLFDDDETAEAKAELASQDYDKNASKVTMSIEGMPGVFLEVQPGRINPAQEILGNLGRAYSSGGVPAAGAEMARGPLGIEPLANLVGGVYLPAASGGTATRGIGGDPLWQEGATLEQKAAPIVMETLRLVPFVNQLVKVGKAELGHVEPSGRMYVPSLERYNSVSPLRASLKDAEVGYRSQLFRIKDQKDALEAEVRGEQRDPSNDDAIVFDLSQFSSQKKRWEEELWPEVIRLTDLARRSEVPEHLIHGHLREVFGRTGLSYALGRSKTAPPLVTEGMMKQRLEDREERKRKQQQYQNLRRLSLIERLRNQ